jgi:hypothetical protein
MQAASIFRLAVTAREGPSRLGVVWGLPPPLFSWYASCDWWRVQFLVVPFPSWGFLVASFPYRGLPHLGYLFAWTLVLVACFFSSPLLRSLSFYKVWQRFIRLHIQPRRCSRLVFLIWLYFTLGRQINTSGQSLTCGYFPGPSWAALVVL